jgi:hypothetical protein
MTPKPLFRINDNTMGNIYQMEKFAVEPDRVHVWLGHQPGLSPYVVLRGTYAAKFLELMLEWGTDDDAGMEKAIARFENSES